MSTPSPLISAPELLAALAQRDLAATAAPTHAPLDWLLCDCRFDLAQPDAGAQAYQAGHLPGASHWHLDQHLSGPRQPGNGRHPLPDRQALLARLAALGAGHATRVVAYDASGGMFASRLWWLMRWLGHEAVWVLDGGLPAWQAAGGSLSTAPPTVQAGSDASLADRPPRVAWVDYATLRSSLGTPQRLIVDARAPDRFRGENETLDPVGGHVPGAVNRFFKDNLQADGRFKPAEQLRAEWQAVMGGRPPVALVQQCGSGVTACHNLVAMAQAGLDGSVLYPGSWSEWCAQPDAVVATG